MRINGDAAGAVAAAAARAGALILQISTNEVFDGTLDRPYREDDTPNPINPYGASKLRGEQLAAEANARHLIVRTAWLFAAEGENFITKMLRAAANAAIGGDELSVVDDEWGNPTPAEWVARAIVQLTTAGDALSVYHLAGEPATTRFGWASTFLTGTRLVRTASAEFPRPSRVPRRAVLNQDRARSRGLATGWKYESFEAAQAFALR
jgi:dTDP-4-dehydrorhamnose reductase